MPSVEAMKEVRASVLADTPVPLLEAMASQVDAMRQARALVDTDGVMVRDGKQNPIPHPCLELERQAQRALNELMRGWVRR
ncbi:MAG: P27 family phage terminase small subunit [Planctomycetota bacterium]|jgi:hypothetical protein